MRDTEVSAIAVKAALTGHLVMSTLHTNSAAESLLRLADMGVAPYLLANALVMIVAQRLVRRVCGGCAQPYRPTAAECEEFGLDDATLRTAKLRSGSGCSQCLDSGYRGRAAVYEVLSITNDLRTLIRRDAPVEDIIASARATGMKLLFQAGVDKALEGITTLAEIRRTLSEAQ
jgi:type II secretory ATPase GspE/PulE/Tfp pilus assembly ATPase PilB-like protein